MRNARELLAHLETLRAEFGDLPVVGGGDLNARVNDRTPGRVSPLAELEQAGFADAQYAVPGADAVSSDHGDPRRNACGSYCATIRPDAADPRNSLDHVHYRGAIKPLSFRIDRSQMALECSDHSPAIFRFVLR